MPAGFHGGRTAHPGLREPGVLQQAQGRRSSSRSEEPRSLAGLGSLAQEHGAGGTASHVSHRVPAHLHRQPAAPLPSPRACLHGTAMPAGFSACSAPRPPQSSQNPRAPPAGRRVGLRVSPNHCLPLPVPQLLDAQTLVWENTLGKQRCP